MACHIVYLDYRQKYSPMKVHLLAKIQNLKIKNENMASNRKFSFRLNNFILWKI